MAVATVYEGANDVIIWVRGVEREIVERMGMSGSAV